MQGRFITFEGIDGAGKSTHVAAVADHLRAHGATVVVTREPGGSELAEALREMLLHRSMDALTEALLVFGARRDHLRTLVNPALQRGDTVLSDRFTDATFAYQGHGHGVDLSLLTTLERAVQEGRQPDLTLWFDVPVSVAAERLASARTPDRFERLDAAFFERVRGGYLARQAAAPRRFVRIDSSAGESAVRAEVLGALKARGW